MSYEGSSYVNSRESPGGPVVKSWIFTAIDLDSILGWGTKIPQTTVVQPKIKNLGFQGGASGKEPTCQCRRPPDLIPGSGRSTGDGRGYPLQYSWASLVAQLVKNLPAM